MQVFEFSRLLAVNLTVSCNSASVLLGSGEGMDTEVRIFPVSKTVQLHKKNKLVEKFTVKTTVHRC